MVAAVVGMVAAAVGTIGMVATAVGIVWMVAAAFGTVGMVAAAFGTVGMAGMVAPALGMVIVAVGMLAAAATNAGGGSGPRADIKDEKKLTRDSLSKSGNASSLSHMSSTIIFSSLLILIFLRIATGKTHLPPQNFNVLDYGAVADGVSENSPAFLRAWEDACRHPGKSRVIVPKGTFKIWSTTFVGPCLGPISFVIEGVLRAPTHPSEFRSDTWLGFRYVDRLSVKGGGYLDGQGHAAWPFNDCSTNPNCFPLPVSLRLDFVRKARINHLRSINSKNTHFSLFACDKIQISRVRLTAPGDSPNTDGIRIGASTNVKISHATIQTGDDCVSIITGSNNIRVNDVMCGPGHGISIGSLGKSQGDFVSDVQVTNCTFLGTQNGARIKTWAADSMSSTVSNLFFGYIAMQNVNNPIIIDQVYCPGQLPDCYTLGKSLSRVQIKDVTFYNIWGTSASKVALALKCSALVPCQDIVLNKIDLSYNGQEGGPAISDCSNVNGKSYGKQFPNGCL
ncbi:unnamed protein product [Cuscuta campestris]|uniref:Pectate lyase superfamily protein domain-containing protein n=1 Tax=Cuscuta campestris TaxID=132261 RepID=A0A484M2K3_9ASTE|nr:unnamed protein product [Cuscuta campestris]